MKLTIDVTGRQLNSIVESLCDNVRYASDNDYNRLPAEDRIRMAEELRPIIMQAAKYAKTSEDFKALSDASNNIDYTINRIKEEGSNE